MASSSQEEQELQGSVAAKSWAQGKRTSGGASVTARASGPQIPLHSGLQDGSVCFYSCSLFYYCSSWCGFLMSVYRWAATYSFEDSPEDVLPWPPMIHGGLMMAFSFSLHFAGSKVSFVFKSNFKSERIMLLNAALLVFFLFIFNLLTFRFTYRVNTSFCLIRKWGLKLSSFAFNIFNQQCV